MSVRKWDFVHEGCKIFGFRRRMAMDSISPLKNLLSPKPLINNGINTVAGIKYLYKYLVSLFMKKICVLIFILFFCLLNLEKRGLKSRPKRNTLPVPISLNIKRLNIAYCLKILRNYRKPQTVEMLEQSSKRTRKSK